MEDGRPRPSGTITSHVETAVPTWTAVTPHERDAHAYIDPILPGRPLQISSA